MKENGTLVLLFLTPMQSSESKGEIRSKSANQSYRANYDSIFSKRIDNTVN